MNQYQAAIGILGGTFDPVHLGHVRMALDIQQAFHLHQVLLIPCYQPVHRTSPLAPASARLAMLQLACAEHPFVLVPDAREIRRQTPSYTIDTLKELRHELPNTPLCLILGMDAFLTLSTWKQYQNFLQYAHLIIASRPTYALPTEGEFATWLKQHLHHDHSYVSNHLHGGIFFQSTPNLDISSSNIRNMIAKNDDPRYLLPDRVYDYIQQQGIYHS